jgi:hypothetical protein
MTHPDPYPARLYQKYFDAAAKLFDDGHVEECILEAKRNLT